MKPGKMAPKTPKFFSKGKVSELRQQLGAAGKKKQTASKIVANMSNSEMLALFPEMVSMCSDDDDLQVKKMALLFFVNYATAKPDLANSKVLPILQRDLNHPSPLIRALAVRTMSSIQLPKFAAALADRLQEDLLVDNDAYVRKTACFAVAKLWESFRTEVEAHHLIGSVNKLLGDSNPTVVASCLAVLLDITERTPGMKLAIDYKDATRIIRLLPDCTEWAQAYILKALTAYVPQEEQDAITMADRLIPRLQHSNSAIVLGTIRLICYFSNYISDQDVVCSLRKRFTSPLINLLSKPPQIQYVTLRNCLLLFQQDSNSGIPGLSNCKPQVDVFFCKYNDPIYVKTTKLEIIYYLTNLKNIDQVLDELYEYATEIDADFARKAVKAIGKLAIKLDVAPQAVDMLLELMDLSNKIPYIVQEVTVVLSNILRKYTDRHYERAILPAIVCNSEVVDLMTEPESKVAVVWMAGEYGAAVKDHALKIMENFISYSYADEPLPVQLAVLTATIKIFIQLPNNAKCQELVPKVLDLATDKCGDVHSDLRDRGFMYLRLLSHDPQAAKHIVMMKKPATTFDSSDPSIVDEHTLAELILELGSIATIYHKPVQQLFRATKPILLQNSPALTRSVRARKAAAQQRYKEHEKRISGGGSSASESSPIQPYSPTVSSSPTASSALHHNNNNINNNTETNNGFAVPQTMKPRAHAPDFLDLSIFRQALTQEQQDSAAGRLVTPVEQTNHYSRVPLDAEGHVDLLA